MTQKEKTNQSRSLKKRAILERGQRDNAHKTGGEPGELARRITGKSRPSGGGRGAESQLASGKTGNVASGST